jgi:transcriptional regulator with XRE-family HTH domain
MTEVLIWEIVETHKNRKMIGVKLRQRREALGLTVQDIARQTGMFDKQIVALESDEHGAYTTDKNLLTRLLMLYARKVQLELDPADIQSIDGARKSGDLKPADHAVPAFLRNRGE